MAIHYHIYGNDGAGGPVDYSTPVGTASATTFDTPALAAPSDSTFAVRAFDTVTGYEDANTDCRVRIVIDAAGADVTGLPGPPTNPTARATAGGGAVAGWTWTPGGSGSGRPTGFKVWLTAGPTPDYGSAPAATVAYAPGVAVYAVRLSGLADGSGYVIAVRATNAVGDESNADVVAAVAGDSTGPDAVDDLAAA